jgi:hypothetical protein
MHYHSTLRTIKGDKDVYTEEMYTYKEDRQLAIIKYFHREKNVGDNESKKTTAIGVYYEIANKSLKIRRDKGEATDLTEAELTKLLKKELSFATDFYKQMKKLK